MKDNRQDIRHKDPQDARRRSFMAGWTDAAVNGILYDTVTTKKTHSNMGNLFGWIYGQQSRDFKMETWYRYRAHFVGEVDTE